MENATFNFDPMTTAWEFGYWTKGWNEPDGAEHQHWEGSVDQLEPWSIERALDRAIELGFLDASDREMVRLTCLNEGEYFFGSDETSGWMIGESDLFDSLPAHPSEPIWMMVKVTNNTQLAHPILDSYEVSELKRENRIIKSDLTLLEILNTVLPGGEKNPKYSDICLQCLYAVAPEKSYVQKLDSNEWVQICRKDGDSEDDDDDLDDEEFDDEEFDDEEFDDEEFDDEEFDDEY